MYIQTIAIDVYANMVKVWLLLCLFFQLALPTIRGNLSGGLMMPIIKFQFNFDVTICNLYYSITVCIKN